MMKKPLLLLLFLSIYFNGFSQFYLDKSGKSLQKGITKYEGYFTFYYDENSDKLFLQIDKIDNDFLYVRSLSEGIGSNDIGLDRGQLGSGVVGLTDLFPIGEKHLTSFKVQELIRYILTLKVVMLLLL